MSERLRQGIGAGGLCALCFAMPVVAGERTFVPPEGCEAHLTAQLNECRVEHHYTCADTGGDRFRIVYTEGGPNFLSRIDAEAQWLSSVSLPDGAVTETVRPADAPLDVSALLARGEHPFDFVERWPNGRLVRATGWDRIVQRGVLVAGEVLHRTVFEVAFTDEADGTLIETYTGAEYVSERWHRFFSGKGTSVVGGVSSSFDRSPREFVEPGEEGFLTVTPKYGCGVLMSALR